LIGEDKDFNKLNDEDKLGQLEKWHVLVHKVFYLLCYKRMKHFFKEIDDEFETAYGWFDDDVLQFVSDLEETEMIPLIIYKHIEYKDVYP
jgi:hypothetical protein